MRELVILSGKGGTGKTSLTGAFASFSKNKILCDADVDAADLHLLTQPDIQRKSDFEGGGVAVIRREECSECGLCSELCRFEAIKDTFEVDEIACEGCGVCVDLCPENAIDFPVKKCGEWYVSATRFGYMVHARLGIAEENSGKLVTVVRQEAKKLAEKHGADLIITDGPPGAGCPVIASMSDATAVLIVTEPTVSGVHDMERAADLVRHFRIPGAVCINKYDLNREKALEAERAAEKRNMPITGRIPFDPAFTKAMIQGKTLCEYDSASVAGKAVQQAWKQIMALPAMQGEGVISLQGVVKSCFFRDARKQTGGRSCREKMQQDLAAREGREEGWDPADKTAVPIIPELPGGKVEEAGSVVRNVGKAETKEGGNCSAVSSEQVLGRRCSS